MSDDAGPGASDRLGAEGTHSADRVALIVGGSSGVGLATAHRLASQGVTKIAIAARSVDRGVAAAASVSSATVEARFFPCDANDAAAAADLVAAVEAAFGSVDLLVVSTAAAVLPRLLGDISPEEIASILVEQAAPPMVMSRAVLPGMRARGSGAIVVVASDAAKSATPGETVIGAAMAAITMFAKAMAMEVKRDGIRVNIVTPSLISGTPIYDRLMEDPFSARLFGKAAKLAALGVANADDVAATIAFLCSPDAARITGQAISVNGGISAA
ncbi:MULTISPECIES: SDR family oxidoreductase [unclassified Sphingopyxis]|uniref:SDR family NAD(P)-dependent oxidoreductase n=1 Tax=unclassified Sphingopyxis TaxID=2614943 RepID=UPI00286032D5|nr:MULTISPECIES: SDR family oxidoreductase [unclassified Sphingopyxis]MDR6834119.1 NAD(P)-dependent dehydrogenase (short-subunit alcohol dehydrogenase family) [Sphingopyxis sp. BE122]MDR7226387.1 NAD(P)-dependent dehydrogenase (short-subunit alcohol dehydrogenase family) [Sphingopyxis sp. BE259]